MLNQFKKVSRYCKDIGRIGMLAASTGSLSQYRSGKYKIHISGVGAVTLRANDSDYETLRQIFSDGEYEIRTEKTMRRLLDRYNEILASGRSPLIVDIGANIGCAALWFSKVWPAAKLLCIEPDNDNFELLKTNSKLNSNINTIKAAIGAHPGFVTLSAPSKSWSVQTERASTGIPVVTMTDCFKAVDNSVPFIIKIDIEGFEADLFSANTEWLSQADAVFIEPHDWLFPGKYTSRNMQSAFGNEKFELLLNGENILYVR